MGSDEETGVDLGRTEVDLVTRVKTGVVPAVGERVAHSRLVEVWGRVRAGQLHRQHAASQGFQGKIGFPSSVFYGIMFLHGNRIVHVFHVAKPYRFGFYMVGLAQMVRASDCGPEGRRFDPDIPPHSERESWHFSSFARRIGALHSEKIPIFAP